MGKGKGMVSALWVLQGDCRTRRQACRRVPARTFSLLQLLEFILFVSGTRGIGCDRACIVLVAYGSAGLLRRGA